MDLVSIVISCNNPDDTLLESVSSARAQSHSDIELVIVDDGSVDPAARSLLETVAKQADHFVTRASDDVPAALNSGFGAASGDLIVPLDCGDVLNPGYVAACKQALREFPEAGFVYTDYTIAGDRGITKRLPDYNLHHLLEENTAPAVALIRKDDWKLVGGYDESLDAGYEWEFWLRLAAKGRFGYHVPKALFQRRESGPSRSRMAIALHEDLSAKIRAKHPDLYSHQARAQIKAQWSPVVCIAGGRPEATQTIDDWETTEATEPREVLKASRAETILFRAAGSLDPHSAEYAALAVWGGNDRLNLADGSLVCSRGALERSRDFNDLKPARAYPAENVVRASRSWPAVKMIRRHLDNAGLLSAEPWVNHPLRSAARLIPLRVKEGVNQFAGRAVFDLSFYLQFQPKSLAWGRRAVAPLQYMPRPGSRRRIALVAPHLGPGGAETVLLDIASALERERHEVFLIATQSRDSRWSAKWQERADHVYDLASLVKPEMTPAALDAIVTNWGIRTVLIQNSLSAYSLIPRWRQKLPGIQIMDLIHAVGGAWDVASAVAEVSDEIDMRIVESEEARTRLEMLGSNPSRIRLIRHGVDLKHFTPGPAQDDGVHRILFVGRLDPVKRPLLLVEIARELAARRPAADFRFIVAGDGPESASLAGRIKRAGVEHLFDLQGRVPDVAPLLATSDLVLIPSKNEGIPLVLLEAFASGRPVVASRLGAIEEVLDDRTGITIESTGDEAAAFAAAIHTLLDQPELRCRMAIAGRSKMEAGFDRQRAQEQYRDLFA